MYSYEKKVLFSDIDSTNRMSVDGILDAMQDCVNINSESIGRGISYMHKTKRAWFAIGWNIVIDRLPEMFEDITVKTWPYGFTATMGYRNVIISDKNGNDIVCADSVWTLMDMNTGMPTRIEAEDSCGYDLEERYPMEAMNRKIRLPKDFVREEAVRVRKSDIDFNGHMTNGRYIQLANDYVPNDRIIKRIRVEYKSQSRLGEMLGIYTAMVKDEKNQGEKLIVRLTDEAGSSTKAVVEYTF